MDIQTIRALISQGKTGEALEALIAMLEKDSRYRDNLLRTLRVTQGSFNAVRQQELKGVIPFQEAQREYNRTTDTLLAILDEFESGRIPAAPASTQRRTLLWGGVALAVVLLGAGVFWLLRGGDKCPEFTGNPKGLKVMVFEFQPVNEKTAPVAIVLRERIEKLTTGKIPVAIAVNPNKGNKVSSIEEAARIGERCGADFVVWGLYQALDRDSFRVKIRAQFTKANGPGVNTDFKPLRDIAALANQGNELRDFDDAFFSLCAMVAIQREKWVMARLWLKRIKSPSDSDAAMQQMVDQRLPRVQ